MTHTLYTKCREDALVMLVGQLAVSGVLMYGFQSLLEMFGWSNEGGRHTFSMENHPGWYALLAMITFFILWVFLLSTPYYGMLAIYKTQVQGNVQDIFTLGHRLMAVGHTLFASVPFFGPFWYLYWAYHTDQINTDATEPSGILDRRGFKKDGIRYDRFMVK